MNIGFIGCGNLALSVIEGFRKGDGAVKNICFFSMDDARRKAQLAEQYQMVSAPDNKTVVTQSDLIVLAVKPNVIQRALEEIQACDFTDKIVLSVAAGVPVAQIKTYLKDAVVLRMMPNILGAVAEGMFVLAESEHNKAEEAVCGLFNQIGRTMVLEEKHMAAITALSGSAPAYVFMFIESLAAGAIRAGIQADAAYEIAAQVVKGSAQLVLSSDAHPAALRDMVSSPGGTTIEAIASLENDGFRAAVINAFEKCMLKA